jgi:uracil DNA glycosylase
MALFCQVKEGMLLEDVSAQVSNLATKVTECYSVFDIFDLTYVKVSIIFQCPYAILCHSHGDKQ